MDERARPRGASRIETASAVLIGFCALAVSAYTAYIQRQQVRAQVWPILLYGTSNEPMIRLTVANKGVGPALIRHVVVTVDSEPVPNWNDAMQKLLGSGRHLFAQSTIGGAVLSAGESVDVLIPYDGSGDPVAYHRKTSALAETLNKERSRVGMEICYCSTLGDCWTLTSGSAGSSTVETRHCPSPSARTFQQ